MFRDRLGQEVKKSDRENHPLALLLIDLDQFKEVNDTLGHEVGDLLLKEVSKRTRSCIRESDTLARLGGDEFTVVLPDISIIGHIEDVAQKIISRLAEPFQLGNEMVYISASIGITIYPNDADDIDALMKNADQAMYVAKGKGRNRYSYFTHSLQQDGAEPAAPDQRLAGRTEAQPVPGPFSTDHRADDGADTQSGSTYPLEASGTRHGQPGRLHPARRGNRPYQRDRGLGIQGISPMGRFMEQAVQGYAVRSA